MPGGISLQEVVAFARTKRAIVTLSHSSLSVLSQLGISPLISVLQFTLFESITALDLEDPYQLKRALDRAAFQRALRAGTRCT